MAKLLYIEASPRKEHSYSTRVAQHFLQSYRQARPDDTVETLDLWKSAWPEFDGATIDAKYRILHGETHTSAEATAWSAVVDTFTHFNSADKYLLSLPMWNFGVPYKLKHYIDIITQPGLSFSFSSESGYTGLVTGKPAAVIYARGGEYSASEQVKGFDFQKPYIALWLGFIGFTDITSILVEPTLGAPKDVDKMLNRAMAAAADAARRF
jgi:FMN-dependent NADH-azoreductase